RVMTREELVEEVGRNIGSSLGAKLAQSSWGGDAEARRFQRAALFRREPRSASPIHIPGHLVAQRPRRFDPRTAPDAVARRFLASYGPATYQDLARWWNGAGIATARQWIVSLGEELTPVDLEGQRAWMLAADVRELQQLPRSRSVRLLPAFDQYVVAASC